MIAPDTVTEAVAALREEGYVDDIEVCDGGLRCPAEANPHALDDAVVDHTFRFEGPSDPGDEMIVLGVTLPSWGRKGVLATAYGPDMEPGEVDALRALLGH